ncbi:alpha/beta hydrolase [Nonomuraea sp. NPDC046802]|uniref:alpha/beta hydrolase n=1 Tax=Nonomuraea sp. NPDC046802 TaxID=3154919 RepID=UPI0033DF10C2
MVRNLALAAILTLGAFLALPGRPAGRLVKVYGDLATADRVALVVPGADTTRKTFDAGTERPGGAARALLAEAARLAPRERLAVVAWLGYDAPPTVSLAVLTDAAAVSGAAELRRMVTELRGRTTAPVSLLCHSYGSVVCAKALPGLRIPDMAVFGSPGLAGARIPPGVRVWTGLADNDWIRFVPKIRLGPLGFGADAMDGAYAARVFETGSGGHSGYFSPGSPSLRNLALIALGRGGEVTS